MPRWDRDELLARTDLQALLDEISGPSARHGHAARWHCPAADHDDLHPSVSVYVDRRGVERWRCWSGGHGGTAIDAVAVARRIGVKEAVEELARRTGLQPGEVERPRFARKVRQAPDPVPLSPDVVRYVEACASILWKPAGRPVLDYLVSERGLEPEVLRLNRVGADPGPDVLRRARGLPHGGVGAVFPVLDRTGEVAYCQTRYLAAGEGRSKYDNPAGRLGQNPRVGWVRPSGSPRTPVLVCEGLPDAYAAGAIGYDAVALLGVVHATDAVAARLVADIGERPAIVALDGDAAGRDAAKKLCSLLAARGTMVVDFLLPPGSDLNSWIRSARDVPALGHPRPEPQPAPPTARVPTVAGP